MTRDALLPEHVYATHSLSIDQVNADQAEGLPRCMMTDAVSILVVARPSRVRTGLQTLLKTLPQVELIEAVDSGRDALPCVVERPPRLVLCDSSLPIHEMHEALQQIKAERPGVLSVVIINSIQDQALAKQAGADAVLLTGYSAETLFTTITGLLARGGSAESTDYNSPTGFACQIEE